MIAPFIISRTSDENVFVFSCGWVTFPLTTVFDFEYSELTKENTIKEIVTNGFFERIQDSVSKKSILEGKCKSCSRACGENLDIHAATHTKEV